MLRDKPDSNLSIGRRKIEWVTSMKYLGFIQDNLLNFEEHIQYVVLKSTKKLGILTKSREFLDRKTPILLYEGLVLPHIDYCDLVYKSGSIYNKNRLQEIQNVACRIIHWADNRTRIADTNQDLQFLNLTDRQSSHLFMECLQQVHKNSGLNNKFNTIHANRVTSGSAEHNMKISNSKTENWHKTFSFRGPAHWNKLLTGIKEITDKKEYKAGIWNCVTFMWTTPDRWHAVITYPTWTSRYRTCPQNVY